MSSPPRNPLYLLLLVAGLVFVLTAMAYALVPVLEQKAIEAGNPPPPSELRDTLRADGWWWLLIQLAVLVVLSVASMVWDSRRSLQIDRAATTIATGQESPTGGGHGGEQVDCRADRGAAPADPAP